MELQPKGFQLDALRKLGEFLGRVRERQDLAGAWAWVMQRWAAEEGARATGLYGAPYRPLPGLPLVPSVCLRLPTGGGKTMLGAMAIGVVAQHYLEREYPLVLWLVPSDPIREQTRKALQNPEHAYRRALGKSFGDRVRVLDIGDFTQLSPQDVRSKVCVLIGTMQTLQVNNTAGRKVYAHNENLEGHFDAAARALPGLEMVEAGQPGAGTPKFSLANVLKVQRPMVIVDEAHRFMTPLAHEVRQRIGAAVIVELTATPDAASNELYRASASQLKADKMIKLPVVLEEHKGDWQQAVCAAVNTRKRLAALAAGEVDYIRPLLLIQAENAGKPSEWQAIKAYLLETEKLAEDEIAVHTGEERELKDLDLFAPGPITTILTVKALQEGWDCSFAYVFCSTANIGNGRDVEQLLGRVLRMPYARERQNAELNKAYAHVHSEQFYAAAMALKDRLVAMGFEEEEAKAALETRQGDLPLLLDRPVFHVVLTSAPDLSELSEAEQATVEVGETAAGQIEVRVRGVVPVKLQPAILASVPEAFRPKMEQRIREHDAHWMPSPAQRGVRFRVPRLTIEDADGIRIPFTQDALAEARSFDLLQYPVDLREFRFDEQTQHYTLDVAGEELVLRLMGAGEGQFAFATEDWTVPRFVGWLGARLRTNLVSAMTLDAWLLKGIEERLGGREELLGPLVRGKFLLLRVLSEAMERAREAADRQAYQELLYGPETTALASEEFSFSYPAEYTASSFCRTRFQKHYYELAGELKDDGEEYRCGVAIDQAPEVKHWVRNLAGQARVNTSFWLQTSTDRFYPDFVAELEDGRVLVVEYKGELEVAADSKEKRQLGELWEQRSGGRGLFLWALDPRAAGSSVADQIGRKVRVGLRRG